eukprot:scaffold42112_cov23-Tisochrysis_lutea.AAC.3
MPVQLDCKVARFSCRSRHSLQHIDPAYLQAPMTPAPWGGKVGALCAEGDGKRSTKKGELMGMSHGYEGSLGLPVSSQGYFKTNLYNWEAHHKQNLNLLKARQREVRSKGYGGCAFIPISLAAHVGYTLLCEVLQLELLHGNRCPDACDLCVRSKACASDMLLFEDSREGESRPGAELVVLCGTGLQQLQVCTCLAGLLYKRKRYCNDLAPISIQYYLLSRLNPRLC